MKIEIRSPFAIERSNGTDTLIETVKARVDKVEPKIKFAQRVRKKMGMALKGVSEELLSDKAKEKKLSRKEALKKEIIAELKEEGRIT